MARAVFGVPMYNAASSVAGALESLLSQDYADLGVVAIDDSSADGTADVARELERRDERLTVEVNRERLGMIGNWNRTLARARELHPELEYFAWASDNDLREPSWLSTLIGVLESRPEAVLAYGTFALLDGRGRAASLPAEPKRRYELRAASRGERFRAVVAASPAGSLIYGLQRRSTLDGGEIPAVVNSDVLFLAHLSLYGTFVQEPAVVWYRAERRTGGGRARQRGALFAGRPPLLTFGPVWLQHWAWLFRRLVLGRRRPAGVGRLAALGLSVSYVTAWWSRLLARRIRRLGRLRAKRARLEQYAARSEARAVKADARRAALADKERRTARRRAQEAEKAPR